MSVKKYDRKDRKSKCFGVKWTEGGQRRFRFFDDPEERDAYLKKLQRQAAAAGSAILKLSAADAAIMAECIQKAGSALNVLRAVDAFAADAAGSAICFPDAVTAYVDEKRNAGRDEKYLDRLDDVFGKFVPEFKGRVDVLSPQEAKRWAAGLGLGPVTVNGHIKVMRSFFNWLAAHGHVRENVFKLVPLVEVPEAEPEFLSVSDCRALLKTAREQFPDAVAYFALSIFAGLRSSAVVGLDPDCIRWDQRGILIRGENAKNKRRQFVDGHEPNLWEWLAWCRKHAPEGLTLSKRMWERRRTQVREACGVAMPKNALRHSFCTYHVALKGDASRTATLLTHRGNVSILYDHYKGNATKGEAQAFFGINP